MPTVTLPINVAAFSNVRPDRVLDCPSRELLEKAINSGQRTVHVTLIASYDITPLDSETAKNVVDLRVTAIVRDYTLYISGDLRLQPEDDGFTVIFDGVSEDSVIYRITYREATGDATYVVLN